MYDFDVVFLLLNSSTSKQFDVFLQLYDAAENAGFHTTIATHPSDLPVAARRLRVIVVDSGEDCDFDLNDVLARVRRLKNVRTVLLGDTDIYLSMLCHPNKFWNILMGLTSDTVPGIVSDSDHLVGSGTFPETHALQSVSWPTKPCLDAEVVDDGWVWLAEP